MDRYEWLPQHARARQRIISLIACGSGGGGKYAKAFASPDRAYVAIVVSDTGSEFGGSSCTDTVVVVPRASVASGRYPADSRAYVGACHTLKMTSINGQRALPDAPQLRWTAPHALTERRDFCSAIVGQQRAVGILEPCDA